MSTKKFAPNDWFKNSANRTVHDVTVQERIKTQRITVTTTRTALPVIALTDRQFVKVMNVGATEIYIGDVDVTTSNGWVILPYAVETFAIEDTASIYGVSAGSVDAIVMEGL